MAKFEIELSDYLSDRAFICVDGRYDVVIIRTDEGLIVDVYPSEWDAPIATLAVCYNDIAELENQPE